MYTRPLSPIFVNAYVLSRSLSLPHLQLYFTFPDNKDGLGRRPSGNGPRPPQSVSSCRLSKIWQTRVWWTPITHNFSDFSHSCLWFGHGHYFSSCPCPSNSDGTLKMGHFGRFWIDSLIILRLCIYRKHECS